jgi:hypothetical protein
LVSCWREPELPARLLERRRSLAVELLELASLVPEEWPELQDPRRSR